MKHQREAQAEMGENKSQQKYPFLFIFTLFKSLYNNEVGD